MGKGIVATNVALLALAILSGLASFDIALIIYWRGQSILFQTINPPVDGSAVSGLDLPSIYSGVTYEFNSTNVSLLSEFLIVEVFAGAPKKLSFYVAGDYLGNYSLFKASLIADVFPPGSGFYEDQVVAIIGDGYSGAIQSQKIVLKVAGYYSFNLELMVHAKNVTDATLVRPEFGYQVTD